MFFNNIGHYYHYLMYKKLKLFIRLYNLYIILFNIIFIIKRLINIKNIIII